MVEDVVGDARDDTHPLGIVEFSLKHMRGVQFERNVPQINLTSVRDTGDSKHSNSQCPLVSSPPRTTRRIHPDGLDLVLV